MMEHVEVSILSREENQETEMVNMSEEIDILPLSQAITCSHGCVFSRHEHNISESEERSKATVKLSGLIVFYLIFMVIEIIGGLKANSLSILTDAAHLLSDVAGCAISLFTVWASGWKPTPDQSFGFNRLEVLGALLSVQLIWVISGILIYEAVDRLLHKSSLVNGKLMFAIAAFGLIINLIMATWIGHHHHHHTHHGHTCEKKHHHHEDDEICEHEDTHNEEEEGADAEDKATLMVSSSKKAKRRHLNINVEGAYLHIMADLIQSIGVMIAGAIIWVKPEWLIVDLICTFIFSILVLTTTSPMVKSIYSILMERTPNDINIAEVEKDIKGMKGVREVHDLHVWAITVGKVVMSCHVIAEPGSNQHDLLHRIRDYCEETYSIHHVTVQIE